MNLLSKDVYGCPYLLLAPMEGVGDVAFRKAIASVGGFDEAERDFVRVPGNAHVKSLASVYFFDEMAPFPLAVQLMGSDPVLMGEMAKEMEKRKAPRIDLNCGCPSNQVTGKGAGSSLLKDPSQVYKMANALVTAVSLPVTVKMRSGYEDTSLFKENLLAAQEANVKYITLHPRTKIDGYRNHARWELIARAKEILKIPLVGNGDIVTVDDAIQMLSTGCDALMIGRGSIINPFLFHEIRTHFSKTMYQPTWKDLSCYLEVYLKALPLSMSNSVKVNKLKQLFSFLFCKNKKLLATRTKMLQTSYLHVEDLVHFATPYLQKDFF